jgi:hypothetical protein
MKRSNLLGKRFGRLLVTKFSGVKNNSTTWECLCDCGKITIIPISHLNSGHTKSCGCLKKERLANGLFFTHRMSKTPLYNIWNGMRDRCNNPNNHAFSRYGGRGINVCSEWNDYQKFYNDMGESYKIHCEKYGRRNTSLERVNNFKGYELNNCVWATTKTQNANRHCNCCRFNHNYASTT